MNINSHNRSVIVRAPAKLNLFLELLKRRHDGYHDIDTVMVPVNCYDTLVVRASTTNQIQIQIQTNWHPSRQYWIDALGGTRSAELLNIPDDERNLIHHAITATAALSAQSAENSIGFDVQVRKRIPAGAGMGGASSDAAAAIRAVAALTGINSHDKRLWQIAEQIGSDVPFFLGDQTISSRVSAIQASGRGTQLRPVKLGLRLHFIIAFPAVSLSTVLVYRNCTVPTDPLSAEPLLVALAAGDPQKIGDTMANRLAEPAIKISTMVSDLLEQMWRCGLPRCQLTGSGSACFSLLDSDQDVNQFVNRLKTILQIKNLPAHIFKAHTITIPSQVRQGSN